MSLPLLVAAGLADAHEHLDAAGLADDAAAGEDEDGIAVSSTPTTTSTGPGDVLPAGDAAAGGGRGAGRSPRAPRRRGGRWRSSRRSWPTTSTARATPSTSTPTRTRTPPRSSTPTTTSTRSPLPVTLAPLHLDAAEHLDAPR